MPKKNVGSVKEFCPRCEKIVTKKMGTDCKYCGYPRSWKEEQKPVKSKKKIKKSPTDVQEDFVALLNSCVEGQDGTWDPTGEGADGFVAMHSILSDLARQFQVDVSKAKEI